MNRLIRISILVLLATLPFIQGSGSYFSDSKTEDGSTFSTGCWVRPSVPVLISPANNTIAGPRSPWTLNPVMDWQDSSSSCPINDPITYQYESYLNSSLTNLAYRSGWLSSSQIPASGTPEGEYWWRVKACDSFNFCSDWSPAWKLTVDNTPPPSPTNLMWKKLDGTVLTCGSETNNYSVIADWSDVVDPFPGQTDHYEYYITYPKLDGTMGTWSTPVTPSEYTGVFNAGEGIHTYKVKAIDKAGNESAWSQDCSITYDKTGPTVSVGQGNNNTPPNTSPIHDAYYLNSPISIFVTVQDANLSGYHLRIIKDGESEAHSCGASLTDASNQGYGKCGYRYNLTSTTGEQRNNEAIATVSASLLGGDGTYWVIIGAIDKAGNRTKPDYLQDPRVRIYITSDTTKPTSIITTPVNSGSHTTLYTAPISWDGVIAGTAADSGSGVAKVLISIESGGLYWNGSAFVSGSEASTRVVATGTTSWTYTLVPAPVGTYTITVHAVDNAGNVEDSYVLTIISEVPLTTPEISLSLAEDKKTVSFGVTNINDIKLSYVLSYDAYSSAKGVTGSNVDVAGLTEYKKENIDLATCSGEVCTYDQNVTNVKVSITLTDKDGKETKLDKAL